MTEELLFQKKQKPNTPKKITNQKPPKSQQEKSLTQKFKASELRGNTQRLWNNFIFFTRT